MIASSAWRAWSESGGLGGSKPITPQQYLALQHFLGLQSEFDLCTIVACRTSNGMATRLMAVCCTKKAPFQHASSSGSLYSSISRMRLRQVHVAVA